MGPNAVFHLPFVRFCVVGLVGFGVDTVTLHYLLATTDAGPYIGRTLSYLLAATVTWELNRRFTFHVSTRTGLANQWLRYTSVNIFGLSLNYGVYAVCIQSFEVAWRYPVLGVAAGSAAGLVSNFLASKHFIFRPHSNIARACDRQSGP